MINLVLGQPGGGKSYESVAFHILPAVVEQGRKVITNLPLQLDIWEAYFPGSSKLIEIRGNQRVNGQLVRPFSLLDHYGDDWRHPDGSDLGPLYVIDECHKSLPAQGTPRDVEEWYAEHRHEGADVLLITQSYGKINKAIRDLVQVVYRCKKATAFGSNDRYIRKVQDGLRGEVVNTSIREYQSKYFPLYKSHTKSNGAVLEALSQDIVPIWKRWPFKGAALCFAIAAMMIVSILTKDEKPKPQTPKPTPKAVAVTTEQPSPVTSASDAEALSPEPYAQPEPEPELLHPYSGKTLHLQGLMRSNHKNYLGGYFVVAQNGQPLTVVSFEDLRTAGYTIDYHSDTVVALHYRHLDLGFVVADLPRTTLVSKLPAANE